MILILLQPYPKQEMITRKPCKMPGLLIRAFFKNPAKGWDPIRAEYGPISLIRPFYAIFKMAISRSKEIVLD